MIPFKSISSQLITCISFHVKIVKEGLQLVFYESLNIALDFPYRKYHGGFIV